MTVWGWITVLMLFLGSLCMSLTYVDARLQKLEGRIHIGEYQMMKLGDRIDRLEKK